MKVDKKLISHLEELARIKLSRESAKKLTSQLDIIIGYVAQLQEVDTTGVAPTSLLPRREVSPLRIDRVVEGLSRGEVLDRAPDAVRGFFRVPKVIDRGDS
ncbi:MAG: Asp-tRNA(Asn)/Glu-tRNA(Gln) amidotransferase subunit GatC [Candidatus Latescibacteria bacterium]|nr:Asp-tRNA(Asn)/Glu-tRNA(Gln) amidotransferase subunit GatC [Candidatus Latescibacterota bacterium]NIM22133.1 Asp-tRNA(Asn)/Glu-tRNA(Gln) amidotransferase subunit GatC [Candidatus Latescibacterota bacterium]NIM64683.1 Asp-tRNA(Asn)/Glu-tRNA(Gln) amidotransferase subunit GatC [Candidatus Latescibacterota bacterium]NIO01193.1 Asp-tRNA(Asn)/Glu-tRNA(Gln) amidotransferase subunit GatC [Candidatus Latescibacterota bacterium]NIO27578.1 Asp-tRNA(Asn)/Glu-tRNA(Gln) amidotransferase subunit GatC [Candi